MVRLQVIFCFILLVQSPVSAEIPLFNGTNLHGFYSWLVDSKTNDPRKVFTVTNRLLRISGDGLGYLSTVRSYTNYHLSVEFKWGSKNTKWGDRIGRARDSGLFLNSHGPDGNSVDGNGAFKAAIECQIMEGAIGDFLLIRGKNSDGTLIQPRVSTKILPQKDPDGWYYFSGSGEPRTISSWGRINRQGKHPDWQDQYEFRDSQEKSAGQWNLLECRCRGSRIEVFLNGVLVNQAWDVFPASGPILIQCEGSEIFFRKISLVEFPK